jgi:hypothetical protein
LRNIADEAGNLSKWELATNAETIAAKLSFEELILDVLPLTSWWMKINEQDTDQRQREARREHEWPRRIKDILCKTATDLGRERYFQGCGMVDVFRAIQSV